MSRMRLFWLAIAAVGVVVIFVLARGNGDGLAGTSGDQFGRALYLGIWGVVVAAGLLGSGRRLGDIARSLGLWVLFALVLVAGYQYRYELQDFASRITAGLIPGSPMTSRDDAGSVMLDKLANGHFGARGEVNGQTVDFIVDTGASSTVLTLEDAGRVGIDSETLAFVVPVDTANGATRAAQATVEQLSIGPITRARLPVLVSERGALGQSLLGMNFIGTLSGFEVRGDRMILRD